MEAVDRPTELEGRLQQVVMREQVWLAAQARRAQRQGLGTSKYVPHQGSKETARRLGRCRGCLEPYVGTCPRCEGK